MAEQELSPNETAAFPRVVGDYNYDVQQTLDSIEARDRHFARLIFLSYRLSQGGIGIQNRILMYVEENFHPELMDSPRAEAVKALTHKIVGRFFLDQRTHPATAIPWEDDSPEASIKTDVIVTNELAGLFGRFHDRQEIKDFNSDIVGIAQGVIIMDGDYLSRPGGRAGDSKELKVVVSPYKRDPYDSMFIKYSVLGVGTGAAEFDAIFSQLATADVLRQLDEYSVKRLKFVTETYCSHHPELASDVRMMDFNKLCSELLDGRR